MRDRKAAEAGKKYPRAYTGEKRKKIVIWKNKDFWWLEKQNVGWKGNLLVPKQNVGWRISPAKNGYVRNVWNSLECKTEKRQRREKKHPRAHRRKKEKTSSFGKKAFFVGWKNKFYDGK